jgi:hypothetical protein
VLQCGVANAVKARRRYGFHHILGRARLCCARLFVFAMQRKKQRYPQTIDQLTVANLVQFLLWLPDEERTHRGLGA